MVALQKQYPVGGSESYQLQPRQKHLKRVLDKLKNLAVNFNLLTISPLYLVIYLFSLTLFSIAVGMLLAGLVFRFGTNVQLLAWGIPFMMQPFMAVYYPVSILPTFIQGIAKLIPASYVFEGLRTVKATGVFDSGNYWISIGLNIILLALGCWAYIGGFKHIKRTGKLVHAE